MRYFAGFVVWALIVSGETIAMSQSKGVPVDEQQPANIRINHDVLAENQRVLEIFLDVLRGTGVGGGFAEIAGCSALPKGRLKVEQGVTVREAMNALVTANPGYQWDVDDGVVNLIPRRGAPLLRTRIAKFQLETTDWELPTVLGDLLALPEVKDREAALGLKQGLGQGGPTAIPKHPVPRKHVPVSINVQNLSVREAFNKVVRASPKSVWIYRETDCNGAKTFTVEMASGY